MNIDPRLLRLPRSAAKSSPVMQNLRRWRDRRTYQRSVIPIGGGPLRKLAWIFGFDR